MVYCKEDKLFANITTTPTDSEEPRCFIVGECNHNPLINAILEGLQENTIPSKLNRDVVPLYKVRNPTLLGLSFRLKLGDGGGAKSVLP